jgi:hypothetical protein
VTTYWEWDGRELKKIASVENCPMPDGSMSNGFNNSLHLSAHPHTRVQAAGELNNRWAS